MTRKEQKFGRVTMVDWGEPEYLDGAMMQFMVEFKKRGDEWSRCAAYFADREHALAFAQMLAGKITHEASKSGVEPDQT